MRLLPLKREFQVDRKKDLVFMLLNMQAVLWSWDHSLCEILDFRLKHPGAERGSFALNSQGSRRDLVIQYMSLASPYWKEGEWWLYSLFPSRIQTNQAS
jgi:hypothetical protein